MTFAIGYVLALLVLALVLFAAEVSVDVVGLLVLLLLVFPWPGILSPHQAISSFGDETVITLILLFVLTGGIVRTGAVERIGMALASREGKSPVRLARAMLVLVVAISAFLSNTVTTAVFLPIVIGLARRTTLSLSKTLMPLAFASILAGSLTLVGTSTNLLISGQLPRYGLSPIRFFEISPIGVGIAVFGLLYLSFVAPRLVPDRSEGELTEKYGLRSYLSEVQLTPGSPLAGKSLEESRLGSAMNLTVLGILRDGSRIPAPGPRTVLREDDVLIIEGKAEDILSIKDAGGVDIRPEVELSDPDLQSEEVRMREAMVLPRSSLVGRTLRDIGFRERTGLTALAIHSAGKPGQFQRLSRARLSPSDLVLLQGSPADFARLVENDDLLLLEDVSGHHPRSHKRWLAVSIFVSTIALGASGLMPLVIVFLLGAVLLVATRCLTPEEAYEMVDWRLMVMIACMIAFGTAMVETGAATYLSDLVVRHVSDLGSVPLIAAFFLFTVLLTQPMSNQAAALVLLPVAIGVARDLGLNPRPFVMSVTLAASCSFLTPLEPSCLLVYGPGRYRFFDFARVGLPLTALVFVISMILIPMIWPVAR